ncbi:DNA repair protein [Colletotrichum tofieldiae]|uniref:DNA repair protein n=1 Tax=Colletotrichum tofieldiae TaxID=708197 RepID=A0A166XL92_9PEZI|nr:DNA repair protein [Colletotrichum tofieldiae]GKT58483.1 DNA repair protein [Colletotrichum tofieldiae]GKT78103.1 DNA repair protein [Colletotrichum tofieldiae]GKT84565.1 DNA repair protein [Colletotrichum tofieldiae]
MARPTRQRAQAQAQGQNQNQAQSIQQNQTSQQDQAAPQNQAQGTNRPARHISGPQSALTDYLASHNISANQIRRDADQRRAAAARSREAQGDIDEDEEDAGPSTEPPEAIESTRNETAAEREKRKKKEQQALAKIKASKAFKKRKRLAEDSEDEDDIARAIFDQRAKPMPGQMDNCAICKKRFTVTAYSLSGPEGGLLCAQCSKEQAAKKGKDAKKPRKSAGGQGSRRKVQSNILDGTYQTGAKNLTTLCIETLAKNVDLADSLGDLPDKVVDKIARLFSKRRLLTPETLPLFVQPSTTTVKIYDGAKLGPSDFESIFQTSSNLQHFKARNAIQFKDEVMDYLLSRDTKLLSFNIHGANLLSDYSWSMFVLNKGADLEGIQVYYTDKHFGDEMLSQLPINCPKLNRLKVYHNQKVTNIGVKAIGDIKTLKHLGLHLQHDISPKSMSHMIRGAGQKLETLSLRKMPKSNDEVLTAIKNTCRSLRKLRITDSEHMTDEGFVDLFTDWENPAIEIIDFQKCRHLESTNPRDNPDGVGLCSDGFRALMKHSGGKLKNLNIHACRHIKREAFEDVFTKDDQYPHLAKLEVSFIEDVDDFVLGRIFRSCPNIREINVFGCMKVKDVKVPRGKVLVGVPNAIGMVIEGRED